MQRIWLRMGIKSRETWLNALEEYPLFSKALIDLRSSSGQYNDDEVSKLGSHEQIEYRPEGGVMLFQQRNHFCFVALASHRRAQAQDPQNQLHDDLLSSLPVGMPSWSSSLC